MIWARKNIAVKDKSNTIPREENNSEDVVHWRPQKKGNFSFFLEFAIFLKHLIMKIIFFQFFRINKLKKM